MRTFCVRQGQTEVGVVEHEGREFCAFGSSVVGRHVTGYTRSNGRHITLTTWCGQTMLDCRCEVVERFWSGTLALMFRLTNNRFVIGYALDENGMLFRGELLVETDEDDARRSALHISNYFADLDDEEEAESHFEPNDERLLDIEYRCPDRGYEWQEQWSCACDSECPDCGTKNITALSWAEAQ